MTLLQKSCYNNLLNEKKNLIKFFIIARNAINSDESCNVNLFLFRKNFSNHIFDSQIFFHPCFFESHPFAYREDVFHHSNTLHTLSISSNYLCLQLASTLSLSLSLVRTKSRKAHCIIENRQFFFLVSKIIQFLIRKFQLREKI